MAEHTITAINYATANFKRKQAFNSWTARVFGKADKVISFSPKDLDPVFVDRNRRILSARRGGGYWIWKPYICLKALHGVKEGEFLFYGDSGSYYIRPLYLLSHFMDAKKLDFLPFALTATIGAYTKKTVLAAMGYDDIQTRRSYQSLGGFFMVRKTPQMMGFFKEFLDLCQTYPLLLDPLPGEEQYEEFIAHRHDQSILTLLCKKYGIPSFRDPSEWGDHALPFFQKNVDTPITGYTASYVVASHYPRIVESSRSVNPLRHWARCRYMDWAGKNLYGL